MLVAVEVVGLLSMLTFIFVAIWGFIILNQIYSQLKYKNYLLEKLNHNINAIRNQDINVSNSNQSDIINDNSKENDDSTN